MRQNLRGFVHLFVPLILALIVFAGIGYYAYKNGQIKLTSQNNIFPPPTINLEETTNWKTYNNLSNNFQIKYPGGWDVKETTSQNEPKTPIVEIGKLTSSNNFSVFTISVVDKLNTQGVDPNSLEEFGYDDWSGIRSRSNEGGVEFDAIAVLKKMQSGLNYQISWVYMNSGQNEYSTEN